MNKALLVLNAGSSSLKFSVFPAYERPTADTLLCRGAVQGIGQCARFSASDRAGNRLACEHYDEDMTYDDALLNLLLWLERRPQSMELVAIGHRVVHGGLRHTSPVLIDPTVIAELRRLIPLAPQHQPLPLAAIELLTALHPSLPQIACFDTAFHLSQPASATTFALPRALTEEGIRRYGFHGLSYEYIASVLPQIVGPELADGRVIVAHLGAGASLCAMQGRKSVATTMGFTALDGLPMSRRCGTLDPGVVLYLIEGKGMPAEAVRELLYERSGLLGVSGLSDDMQTLLASDDPHAAEAIDLFVYRAGREIGSLAAAMGGLDALIFTAGIGEHAAPIRQRICESAAWLGIEPDATANAAGGPCITRSTRPSAWVVPTHEDLMIACHSWDLLQ